MVNKIERRDNDIEIMRENYLEYYYDDEQYNLDDESLQALGLNMYVRKQEQVYMIVFAVHPMIKTL